MSTSATTPQEIDNLRRHWFGTRSVDVIAKTVLLMERDRVEQYMGALDSVEHKFGRGYGGKNTGDAVFHGVTGTYRGLRLSVIYSIGPAHVSDCVTLLADYFDVKQIVATGSVGGIGDTHMGDIIVVNRVTTQDGFSLAVNAKAAARDPVLGYQVEVAMEQELRLSTHVAAAAAMGGNILVGGKIYTVPAICLETAERLGRIRAGGYAAIDLETGPFLSACKARGILGAGVHWVTDLPETFAFHHASDERAYQEAIDRKHAQWLNMPRIILPIVVDLLSIGPTSR